MLLFLLGQWGCSWARTSAEQLAHHCAGAKAGPAAAIIAVHASMCSHATQTALQADAGRPDLHQADAAEADTDLY